MSNKELKNQGNENVNENENKFPKLGLVEDLALAEKLNIIMAKCTNIQRKYFELKLDIEIYKKQGAEQHKKHIDSLLAQQKANMISFNSLKSEYYKLVESPRG